MHVQFACIQVGEVGPEVDLVEGHPLRVAVLVRADGVAHHGVVGVDVTVKLTERGLLPLELDKHTTRGSLME